MPFLSYKNFKASRDHRPSSSRSAKQPLLSPAVTLLIRHNENDENVWWNRIPTPLSAASRIVAVLLTFTDTCYTRAGSLNLQRSKTYQLIEPGIDIYQQEWHIEFSPKSQQAGAASPSGSLRKSLSSTLISTCAASMPGVCGLWMTIRPFLLRLATCRAVSNPVSPCVYSIQSIFITLITSPWSLPSLPLPDLPLSNLALSDLPLSNLDLSLSNSVLPDQSQSKLTASRIKLICIKQTSSTKLVTYLDLC